MTAEQRTKFSSMTREALAAYIQHTKIETGATKQDMIVHATECVTYGFDAAMVSGSWLPLVVDVLKGTSVITASALDFPTVGAMTSTGKAAEAARLAELGAQQIDMGVQIGWLKSGDFNGFRDDIAGVVRAAAVPIKVMLELPLLTDAERKAAIELSVEAGATYLKNASSGQIETANPESIRYLVDHAPDGVLVKASGSITSYEQTVSLLEAGAVRVGSSAGIAIVTSIHEEKVAIY